MSNLSEQSHTSRTLGPNQSLEINFVPGDAGEINIVAETLFGAGPMPGFGVARRVELFAPGASAPVASKEGRGLAMVTMLSHVMTLSQGVLNGDWTARVTNIDTRPANFRLQVAFPGAVALNTTTVPVHFVQPIVDNLLAQTQVRITRGANASFVQLPTVLSVEPVKFTVPDFDRTINLLLVRVKIVEFPNDVRSNSTKFALLNSSPASPSGTLRLTLGFEDAGREILGTFQADLSDVHVTIELPLDVEDHKVTYSLVRATCSVGVDITGLPDGVLNAIFHYQETLQRKVVEAVEDAFEQRDVRAAISEGMTTALSPLMGSNNAIASVTVTNGQLVIASFAAGKRAAA